MPPKRSPKGGAAGAESPATKLRFAHPFFSPTTPAKRAGVAGHGTRMLDHIQTKIRPIPPVRGDSRMSLADVIGASGEAAIAAAGEITIHIAGDTGVPEIDRETKQVVVADAMARDFKAGAPDKSPAFFLHLGDVIYGADSRAYLAQFYRPNMHYPGKIVAIPGNHDGESDEKLTAFQENFCAKSQAIPPIAGSIFRQTMDQPGVYWLLDTPFLQIVGMYSNAAENPGFISGGLAGTVQKDWLVKALQAVKKERDTGVRKALFFATHHPPFSSGGHSGSQEMLADIDDACAKAKIQPDAFFSGHAHSLQRYTRTVNGRKIPYIVSGCGGHGGQTVATPPGTSTNPSVTFDFSYKGWGYTKARVAGNQVTITSYSVDETNIQQEDQVKITLA